MKTLIQTQDDRTKRWITLLEVLLLFTFLEVHLCHFWEWSPLLFNHKDVFHLLMPVLIAMILIFSLIKIPLNLTSIGLRTPQWKKGWPSMIIFTIVSLFILLFWRKILGEASINLPTLRFLYRRTPEIIGQQLLLQGFVLNRLLLTSRKKSNAIWFSSLLFTLLHIPNPILTTSCAAASLFWT